MKQAENKSDALWKRMAKLREEVQSGQTALEEMRKSGKNSVKFLDVTYVIIYEFGPGGDNPIMPVTSPEEEHCQIKGPYYRDRVLIRTFLAFWVPIGSFFIFQGPYFQCFGFIHAKKVNSVCMYTAVS